jgi:uncharacterized membrane protein YcaP (DUF421 family)
MEPAKVIRRTSQATPRSDGGGWQGDLEIDLLIVAETTQQALTGQDYSITNSFLLIVTLIGLDIGLSLVKQRSKKVEQWLDNVPLVIVENGKPFKERMDKARIDEEDILNAARMHQGLERMDQIKYAALERSGGISIIPKST